MSSRIKYSILTVLVAVLFFSCKHEPLASEDEQLYNESQAGGLLNFRNGDLLDPLGGSPHGSFTLKLNAIAQGVLDSNGKVPENATFPNGSLIVKEVMKNGKLDLLAIMKKDSTNSFSGQNWLWGEYEPDGQVYYSVSRKGSGCTGCHGGTPNSDLTRVFDLH